MFAISLSFIQIKQSFKTIIFPLKSNIVERKIDINEKRIYHLYLTKKGKTIHNKLETIFEEDIDEARIETLESILKRLQIKNGMKSFGVCLSCKFPRKLSDNKFRCELLNEELAPKETFKICKEHSFN